MSRALLFPVLLLCCLMVLAGCGGGSSPTGGGGGGGGGFSNASLTGTYAFLFSSGTNGGAGSFKADGAGNLVSGTMEINNEVNHFSNVPLTGTYNVSPDGRGTATLNTRFENFNLHFVIISSRHLLVSHFNVNSIDINIRGVGSIDLQDTTAFSAAALKGQFAYTLDGDIKSAGGFILDGVGAISAGVHDLYDSSITVPGTGFNQPLSGSYSVPAGTNGRGTLTLNTAGGPRNFIFYIVSSGQFKIISADRPPYSAGEAFTGSNATAASPGCGTCIFFWNTLSASAYSAAGMFTHDSAGNITGGHRRLLLRRGFWQRGHEPDYQRHDDIRSAVPVHHHPEYGERHAHGRSLSFQPGCPAAVSEFPQCHGNRHEPGRFLHSSESFL